MKKLVSALLIGITLGSISCDREAFLDRRSDRLEGSWDIHRVRLSEPFRNNWANVTDDYKSIEINFFEPDSMVWIDTDSNKIHGGTYQMYFYNDIAGGDASESGIRLTATLQNNVDAPILIDWENLTVTQNRLRFSVRQNGESYQFVLKKD